MAHLTRKITVNAPVDMVYARARDPEHWSDWYAGLSEPDELTGTGETGTVVKQSYLIAGKRFPVTSRVVEDHVGPKGAHWRGKIEGPLAGEQDMTFVPRDGSTEITMDLDYTVPGSILGKFADAVFIERMMGNAAQNTLDNLKFLCESEK